MARRTSRGRPHLGVGMPFSIRPQAGSLSWARHEQSIEVCIAQILETSPAERVMRPAWGAGLRDRIFAPNNPPTHRELEVAVREALIAQEPRIELEGVRVRSDAKDPNVLLIDIDYAVRATNTSFNRVFPFYLTEAT